MSWLQKEQKKIVVSVFIVISCVLAVIMGRTGIGYIIFALIIGVIFYWKPSGWLKSYTIPQYLLAIPIIIFLASRLLPFYLYGPHPLGYDTGFYKYNIVKERTHSLGDLHISPVESTGSRILTKALIAIGLSDNAILYWWYIGVGFAVGVMIYLLSREYFEHNAAFFSTFFYSISFVQFLAYWDMFWKNSFTLFLMLLIFYLLGKNKALWSVAAVPAIVMVFITHKTSAFLLFLTLIPYFLSKKNTVKYWIIPIVCMVAAIVAWQNKGMAIYLWQQITSAFTAHYDFFSVKEGIFIDTPTFLSIGYSLFYLPFGIITVLDLIQKKKMNPIVIMGCICAVLVMIQFVFYKRLFVFLDISLLILMGYSFNLFVEKLRGLTSVRYATLLLSSILLGLGGIFFVHVVQQKPLISKEIVQDIQHLSSIYPETRLLTYDSFYTPWLYGFSGHKIIAPGWGDDKWTLDRWQVLWSADMDSKITMLSELHPPLLIYDAQDGFLHIDSETCIEKIGHVLKFDCK